MSLHSIQYYYNYDGVVFCTQKQAKWLDVTIGKFELTEWHRIAEEWFKEKPRNSDQVRPIRIQYYVHVIAMLYTSEQWMHYLKYSLLLFVELIMRLSSSQRLK